MKIKYLITDVDGVVFDRMAAIVAAFAAAMRPLGVPEEQVSPYLYATLGATFEAQTKGLLAEIGKTIGDDEMRQARRRFWDVFDYSAIRIFPGVKDTLDELKARGTGILVSTGSTTTEIEGLFKEYRLPRDLILGSDEILKGDEHIDFFAKHLSLPKPDFCRQAAFVGDGTVDMQIAARNGIYGIGITNSIPANSLTAAGARMVIANFSELTGLI